MGGWHVTLFPVQTCSDPLVDFVITHEGESSFLKLANALREKKSYKKIPGLVYKDNNQIKCNPPKFIDFNSTPLLAYHLVDTERYISESTFEGRKMRWFPYQSTRGCPHRCTFCINPTCGNTKYRMKDPDKVISEIKQVIKTFSGKESKRNTGKKKSS